MRIDPYRIERRLNRRIAAALILVPFALSAGWVINEFASRNWLVAISGLNTYNLIFLLLGMLLHWRPKRFLRAVSMAVPVTSGVLTSWDSRSRSSSAARCSCSRCCGFSHRRSPIIRR